MQYVDAHMQHLNDKICRRLAVRVYAVTHANHLMQMRRSEVVGSKGEEHEDDIRTSYGMFIR